MVLAGPRLVDLAGDHAAKCMSRARVDQRQVEVPDEEEDREQREDVVDGAGAVEDEAVVALAQPEEDAGQGEEQREGDRQQGVDLLAGVEAPLRRPPAGQPAPVVTVDGLDVAPVLGQALAVSGDDDHDDRDHPGDGDPDVDVADELAAADERRERRQVEDQPRREEGEERRRMRPVEQALGAGEALDAGRRERRYRRELSSHWSDRARRRRRSHSAPSSRAASSFRARSG